MAILRVVCPGCGADKASPNPAGFDAGAILTCAKCKETFIAGDAVPVAVAKVAAVKAAKAVAVEDDDRPRKKARRRDDDDNDERPRKKSKKAKDNEGSAGTAVFWLIRAGVLVVLLAVAGGLWLMLQDKWGKDAETERENERIEAKNKKIREEEDDLGKPIVPKIPPGTNPSPTPPTNPTTPEPPKPKPKAEPFPAADYDVKSNELSAAYEKNATLADAKFGEKTVRLQGTYIALSKPEETPSLLIQSGSKKFKFIYAELRPDVRGKLPKLTPFSPIHVQGICLGLNGEGDSIRIGDCVPVSETGVPVINVPATMKPPEPPKPDPKNPNPKDPKTPEPPKPSVPLGPSLPYLDDKLRGDPAAKELTAKMVGNWMVAERDSSAPDLTFSKDGTFAWSALAKSDFRKRNGTWYVSPGTAAGKYKIDLKSGDGNEKGKVWASTQGGFVLAFDGTRFDPLPDRAFPYLPSAAVPDTAEWEPIAKAIAEDPLAKEQFGKLLGRWKIPRNPLLTQVPKTLRSIEVRPDGGLIESHFDTKEGKWSLVGGRIQLASLGKGKAAGSGQLFRDVGGAQLPVGFAFMSAKSKQEPLFLTYPGRAFELPLAKVPLGFEPVP